MQRSVSPVTVNSVKNGPDIVYGHHKLNKRFIRSGNGVGREIATQRSDAMPSDKLSSVSINSS